MAVLVKPASDKFNILIGSTKHEIASARARKRERLRLVSTYVKERDYSSTTGMIMNERVPSSKYKYLISMESRFAKTSFFPGYVLYRRGGYS